MKITLKFLPKLLLVILFLLTMIAPGSLFAQVEMGQRSQPELGLLNEQKVKQLDASVKKGLAWLISQQNDDGSFKAIELGQPAVTALCVICLLYTSPSPRDRQKSRMPSSA